MQRRENEMFKLSGAEGSRASLQAAPSELAGIVSLVFVLKHLGLN